MAKKQKKPAKESMAKEKSKDKAKVSGKKGKCCK